MRCHIFVATALWKSASQDSLCRHFSLVAKRWTYSIRWLCTIRNKVLQKCTGGLNPKLATLLKVTEKYVKMQGTIWCTQNGPKTDCGVMDTVNKRHISNMAEVVIWC